MKGFIKPPMAKFYFLSLASNTLKHFSLFFCLSLGFGVTLLGADLNSLNQSENRRIEQERLQKLEESFIPTPKASPKPSPQNQEFTYPIKEIEIIGNTILPPKVLEEWKDTYKGIKDIQSLQKAVNHLENLYLNRGYISTRIKVDLSQVNSPDAKLILRVLEGRIDKYLFNNEENPLKSLLTFPKRKNGYFNIYDIDQAVDNLSSLANISINPSSKLGYSLINVETPKKPDLRGKVNYNNLGDSTTGRARAKISLNSKDILGLNENLFFYYQQRLNPTKRKNITKNYLLSFNFPWQYYNAGYSYESSNYKQELYALNRIYSAQGSSTTQNFNISRILYRNANSKLDFKVNLALKKIENLLDNHRLILSSRRLSVISVESSYLGRVANGLMSANIGLHQGLKHFKANKDNEWYRNPSTPEAKFFKYSYSLSWYKPFNAYYYKIDFSAQGTKDILYSNEKLYIGDDTTIRGFKNNGLQGDKGYYLKNELGVNLKGIKPFIAYDIGRIKNSYGLETNGRELQGISMGAKITYRSLEADLTFSKALKYPKALLVNKKEIYTSITWGF